MHTFLFGLIGSTFNGLLLGSLYGIMGVGLALLYRVTKIPNFAYAEYVTYGGYAAFFFAGLVGGALGVVIGILGAMLFSAVISLITDELGFKPLWKRGASSLHLLVASIGIGFILRYGLLGSTVLIFGPKYLSVSTPQRNIPFISIGNIATFGTAHAIAIGAGVAFSIALWYMFTRTKIGKAMRATASNPQLARISGINIFSIRRMTWLLSGSLAGFSGFIYAYYNFVNPESGWLMLLWIFAAATLGGFTFFGTIIGGLILGLAAQYYGFLVQYIFGTGSQYSPAVGLAAMFIVLMFKPEGVIRIEALAVRKV
ncbi:MAG: branched-chain amino acid ABC transporter permease [Desulfurococcales archaeon]|nr:branched-chain amino acid ABC transporter permease [Desulfurococcales archaeon]